jgi:peptidoglycan/xylan/chitin deacetylase (PgdA/CDA1 family)
LVALARVSGNPRAFFQKLESAYPLPAPVKAEYEGMTSEQLATLAGCDFLEAGGHSISHPYLHELSRQEQAEEIFQCKQRLAELVGKPIRYFAYPNGDYDRNTLDLVRDAGFEAAFALLPRSLGADGPFEVGRIGIYSASFLKFWLKARGVAALARRFGLSVG